jgi:hypothetical protein
MRFGQPGEIVELFQAAGMIDIVETTLEVSSTYADFDELWSGFLEGVGPAGSYCVSLAVEERNRVKRELFTSLGSPTGPLTLRAVARAAVGHVPT